MLPFFTIGHSTRTIEAFVQLLQTAEISLIADIRSIPRSRTNPQFNSEVLAAALAAFNISYVFIPELGGRRRKEKTITPDTNSFWENRSFHNYADYALTAAFQDGLNKLLKLGASQRCAFMCSEAVWWRCHRRIVADYLLARGEKVIHLMDPDKLVPASLTPVAVVRDQLVTYPAVV